MLGNSALPVAEIVPKGGFYDYAHKYQDGYIEEICPAKIDEATERLVKETALKCFSALRLEVYARMDFILDERTGGIRLPRGQHAARPDAPQSHMPGRPGPPGMSITTACGKYCGALASEMGAAMLKISLGGGRARGKRRALRA